MSQTIKDKLIEIVGAGNVADDAATLKAYSQDPSFTAPRKPNFVVKAASMEQIQGVVRYANEIKMPVVPYSSGTNFQGGTIPTIGGIVLDMTKMKKISEYNSKFWSVTIEPGVTVAKLQDKVKKDGLRLQVPLMSPPNSSALTTYLDREEVPGAGDLIYGNEQIQTFRVVLPQGDSFTIGNPAMPGAPHSHPLGPALNWYRMFMCAQGTLGICYEMNLRLIPIPKVWKIFFSEFDNVKDVIRAIKVIQRKELGYEVFALNNFDMATLLLKEDDKLTDKLKKGAYIGNNGAPFWTHDMRHSFDEVRAKLAPWTLIVSISGWARQPEAKVAYQEKDFREAAAETGFEIRTSVGGYVGLDRLVMDELVLPWRMQKRHGFKGGCHELKFHALGSKLPQVEAALQEVCARYNYSAGEIGAYVQPIERARTFSCVFDLHCFPDREADYNNVKELFIEASEAMIKAGAFFDRPYGCWADMMYRRNATYAEYLKKIKTELDPNNVLNPGKLCF
jgi:FAD/FMN-containing dehydrogenase